MLKTQLEAAFDAAEVTQVELKSLRLINVQIQEFYRSQFVSLFLLGRLVILEPGSASTYVLRESPQAVDCRVMVQSSHAAVFQLF